MERIIYSLLLLASIYLVPIWLFVILCLVGILLFDQYYEAVILWFFLELIFGIPLLTWSPFIFIGTISMVVLVLVSAIVKKMVLLN